MPEYRVSLGQNLSDRGRTVLELMVEGGYDLPAACGGGGRCGKCLVRLSGDSLPPPTAEESTCLSTARLAEGWRLACQVRISGPVTVLWEGSAAGRPGKGFAVSSRALPLAPAVMRRTVVLREAVAKDQQGDWERITSALGCAGRPDLWSCSGLAGIDRRGRSLAVIVDGRGLLGAAPPGRLLGAVFDLGTTTVVGGLVDLEDGTLLDVRSAFNAQRIYGADVLARLGHAQSGPEGRGALRDRIRGQVRTMLGALLADTGAGEANLVDLVMVGNTAMEHLFFGFDPGGLAALPFVPVHQAGLTTPMAALDLPAHPGARMYSPPNLSGFIGSDTVAGVIAADLARRPGPVLLVDLGTNGELVLSHEGRLWACSTAAGPAFEGAEIACGMPGLPGAIERVELDGDLRFTTIEGSAPRGICGSGLIDAVAVLRRAGAIDVYGRIQDGGGLPPELAARLRPGARGTDVFLAPAAGRDLVLTQGDVRQVQLAKGAIAAGVRLLCQGAGIAPGELRQVLLAGAFGQHVDVAKAACLGILPGIEDERILAVGNTAGEGARLMLTNAACRDEAEDLVGRVEVVELAADPEFQMVFAEEMLFPEC